MDADRRVKITKTDNEWRQELTPELYHVTRRHGTARYCMNGVALKFAPDDGEQR